MDRRRTPSFFRDLSTLTTKDNPVFSKTLRISTSGRGNTEREVPSSPKTLPEHASEGKHFQTRYILNLRMGEERGYRHVFDLNYEILLLKINKVHTHKRWPKLYSCCPINHIYCKKSNNVIFGSSSSSP